MTFILRRIAAACAALVLVTAFSPETSRADGIAGPDWVTGAYFVTGQPDAFGGELAFASLFQPFADHELLLGPSISALVAGGENGVTRFDLNWGFQEVLWIVNAVGTGLNFDVVAPSTITGESASIHFRVTPSLSIRVLHVKETGALALRFGVPYDTHYKWGIQAGVTLQFNGIL